MAAQIGARRQGPGRLRNWRAYYIRDPYPYP